MRVLKELVRRPSALIGLMIVAIVVLGAIFAPWITHFSPDDQLTEGLSLEGAPMPPGTEFIFGTDTLGRDLFARVVFGARTSLAIGLVANGTAVAIGLVVGLLAGYLRGWAGNLLMRFTDLMMAFPALLLAIALAA
jgi:peptide/nickel transport system permease protein